MRIRMENFQIQDPDPYNNSYGSSSLIFPLDKDPAEKNWKITSEKSVLRIQNDLFRIRIQPLWILSRNNTKTHLKLNQKEESEQLFLFAIRYLFLTTVLQYQHARNSQFYLYALSLSLSRPPEPWMCGPNMAALRSENFFSRLEQPHVGTMYPVNWNRPTVQARAVDPDPHGSAFIFPPGSGLHSICGSGSRGVNLSTKNWKKARKLIITATLLCFF